MSAERPHRASLPTGSGSITIPTCIIRIRSSNHSSTTTCTTSIRHPCEFQCTTNHGTTFTPRKSLTTAAIISSLMSFERCILNEGSRWKNALEVRTISQLDRALTRKASGIGSLRLFCFAKPDVQVRTGQTQTECSRTACLRLGTAFVYGITTKLCDDFRQPTGRASKNLANFRQLTFGLVFRCHSSQPTQDVMRPVLFPPPSENKKQRIFRSDRAINGAGLPSASEITSRWQTCPTEICVTPPQLQHFFLRAASRDFRRELAFT